MLIRVSDSTGEKFSTKTLMHQLTDETPNILGSAFMPRAPKRLQSEPKTSLKVAKSESSQSSKRQRKTLTKGLHDNMPSKPLSKPPKSRSVSENVDENRMQKVSVPRPSARQLNDPITGGGPDYSGIVIPDENFSDYSSEPSMVEDESDELDFIDSDQVFGFPFILSNSSGDGSGSDFVQGLSSSDSSKVSETLERLNDFVNMSFDDISFSLPVDKLVPILFKIFSQKSSSLNRSKTIAGQIISVFLDSSVIATKLIASTPLYLSTIEDHIRSMDSLETAEQCVVIVSRMVKDHAKAIGDSGIAPAILDSFSFFCLYTQKQCMQILEDLVGIKSASTDSWRNQLVEFLSHEEPWISQKASSCWLKSVAHTPTTFVPDPVVHVLCTSTDPLVVKNLIEGLLQIVIQSPSVSPTLANQLVSSGGLKLSAKDIDLLSRYCDLLTMIMWTSGLPSDPSICMHAVQHFFLRDRELQNDSTCLFVLEFFKHCPEKLPEWISPVSRVIHRMLECRQSYQLVTLLRGLEIANRIKDVDPLIIEKEKLGLFAQQLVEDLSCLPDRVVKAFKQELVRLVGKRAASSRRKGSRPVPVDSLSASELVEMLEMEIEKMFFEKQFPLIPAKIFEHPLMLQIGENKSIAEPAMTVSSLLDLIEDGNDTDDKELSVNGYQVDAKDADSMTILEAIILSWKRQEYTFSWSIPANVEDVFSPRFEWVPQDEKNKDQLKAFIWSKKPHVVAVCLKRETVGEEGVEFPELVVTGERNVYMQSSQSIDQIDLILESLAHKFQTCVAELPTESFSSPRLDRLVRNLCSDRLLFGTDMLEKIVAQAGFVLSVDTKAALTRRRFDAFKHAVSKRQKMKLDRNRVLTAGMAVLDLFGASSTFAGRTVLEMEFSGEIGSGSGPTNEFYALCCEQLKAKKKELFRQCPDGSLYPRVEEISREALHEFLAKKKTRKTEAENGTLTIDSEEPKTVLDYWWFMGLLVGRGIADNRLVDLNYSWVMWQLVHAILCGQDRVEVDEKWIHSIDPSLVRSMDALDELGEDELVKLEIATNVMPGNDEYTLPSGIEGIVSKENLPMYREEVVSVSLLHGVFSQMYVFAEALGSVVGKDTMKVWSNPHEVTEFIAGSDTCGSVWSVESLSEAFHAQHGYTWASPQIQHLIEIVSELTDVDRGKFVKFVTGSNRLPVGGFKALNPPLTVVKATRDEGYPDSYLPSVMTCANFIKLPEYSTKLVMKNQLMRAIQEGQGSFLLS